MTRSRRPAGRADDLGRVREELDSLVLIERHLAESLAGRSRTEEESRGLGKALSIVRRRIRRLRSRLQRPRHGPDTGSS